MTITQAMKSVDINTVFIREDGKHKRYSLVV